MTVFLLYMGGLHREVVAGVLISRADALEGVRELMDMHKVPEGDWLQAAKDTDEWHYSGRTIRVEERRVESSVGAQLALDRLPRVR